MSSRWLGLVDSILRPARPALERCVRERDLHRQRTVDGADGHGEALARCQADIERERAAIFAAADGVVSARMTELEREWRRLVRLGRDGHVMSLWSRIAPADWLDRKLWRDSDPARQLDAAVGLAADIDAVAEVEASLRELRRALAAWEVAIGPKIRWCLCAVDSSGTAELLVSPLLHTQQALEALGESDERTRAAVSGARRLEGEVRQAMRARFPLRPLMAETVAQAAFLDEVWRTGQIRTPSDPVAPLCRLWAAGYALAAVDESGVTVEIAPL